MLNFNYFRYSYIYNNVLFDQFSPHSLPTNSFPFLFSTYSSKFNVIISIPWIHLILSVCAWIYHVWEVGEAAGPVKPTCLLPCPSMRSEAACVGCLPGWTVPRDPDLSAYLWTPKLVPGACVNSDWMRWGGARRRWVGQNIGVLALAVSRSSRREAVVIGVV